MWECKSTNIKFSQVIQLLNRGSWKSIALFVPIAPISLVALLGLGGATWLVQTAIAPPIAQAYTARVDVSLNHENGETYQTLVRRAEAVARAAAQRSFDQDILVTDVSVTVLVQNQGTIAPILSLEATRQGWKSRPDPQRWTKYYPTAQSLLQLPNATALPAIPQGIPSSPYQRPTTTSPVPPPPPATTPNFQRPPSNSTTPTTPNFQRPPTNSTTPTTPRTPQRVVPLPTPTTR